MGRRGPNKDDFSVIRGTSKEADTPKPPVIALADGVPEPPYFLTDQEREVWNRVCVTLDNTSLLTEADVHLVARYSQNIAELIYLREILQRHRDDKNPVGKEMLSNKNQKYFVKHPEISRIEKLESLIMQQEKELGFTPASRSGMKMPKGKNPRKTGDRAKLFGA